ncbi:MAG: HTH-type transcriptional regulator, competence development regulator [Pseudomonadota bacterium]|nr:HTH-type transcriptional regulator, competence development regulator [Pseudomonadota bacterium]
MNFGSYVRWLRQRLYQFNSNYTVQQTAERVGISTTYLCRIERSNVLPPSEDVIRRLAAELGEEPDVLLALAGRLASDVNQAIIQRPILFAELIRTWSDLSDEELTELLDQFRNGQWPTALEDTQ